MPRGGKVEGTINLDTRPIILELRKFLSPDKPVSLRFCLYQLVSRGVLTSTSRKEYTQLMRALVTARIRGVDSEWGIDDDCIVDNRRRVEEIPTWNGLEEFKCWAAEIYRRDRWAVQPAHFECWLEKDTAAFLVSDVCNQYGIPLRVSAGSFSRSFLVHAADRIHAELPKRTIVAYVGDCDAKGWDIERAAREGNGKKGARRREGLFDILQERHRWTAAECQERITWRRLAVTKQDFREMPDRYKVDVKSIPVKDAQGNLIKAGDATAPRYVDEFGERCCELEALEVWKPGTIAARLEEAIRDSIEWVKWKESEAREERERARLLADGSCLWDPYPVFGIPYRVW